MTSESDRNIHSPLAYSMEVSSPAHFHQFFLRLSDGPNAKGLCMVRNNDQDKIDSRKKISGEPAAHSPVLANEILSLVNVHLSGELTKTYVDGTLGLAGHAGALLTELPNFTLIGLDKDAQSIPIAIDRLKNLGVYDRCTIYNDSFDNFDLYVGEKESTGVDFFLLDLGFSSYQIEDQMRGFSYRLNSKLDMRMNSQQGISAYEVVNRFNLMDLSNILKVYGDEKFSRKIAQAICDNRPIETTFELNQVIKTAIPAATRRTGGHPSQRTFQAIRIYVNSEFEQLYNALNKGLRYVAIGGLIAVLTYHSGEDRLVKNIFDLAVKGKCKCPDTIQCACGAEKLFEFPLARKGLRPSQNELIENPRARSAHLRVIKRTSHDNANDLNEIYESITRALPIGRYVYRLQHSSIDITQQALRKVD